MEPNKQWGTENDYATLMVHIKELMELGLKSVMLFGVVAHDDKCPNGMYVCCMCVCLCVYVIVFASNNFITTYIYTYKYKYIYI